jgi:hypothetical protein
MDIKEINSSNEFRHPWEISRSDCLLRLAGGYAPHGSCADIGSGDLYFANRLAETGRPVTAVDQAYGSLKPANPRGLALTDKLPAGEKFGTVFLLDVLEHSDDEAGLLAGAASIIDGGGRLFVTVPAFGFLFSGHDKFLSHKRRYSRKGLERVLLSAGLEAEEIFYFYASLLPLRLFEMLVAPSRLSSEKREVSSWRHGASSLLTAALTAVLNADFRACRFLSRFKIYIPGLSVCAVCRKTSSL